MPALLQAMGERPVGLDGAVDERLARLGVDTSAATNRASPPASVMRRDGLFAPLDVDIGDDDAGAVGGVALGDGPADAGGGSVTRATAASRAGMGTGVMSTGCGLGTVYADAALLCPPAALASAI